MRIEVDKVYKLNGGDVEIAAKVTGRPEAAKGKIKNVAYVARKNNLGAWSRRTFVVSLREFKAGLVGEWT